MRILVTGGAGYVGSVSVERLLEAGHDVTVLDTLVTGHRGAVDHRAELVVGSIGDPSVVGPLLRRRGIEAVLHCAARSLVGESVREPALYERENVVGGRAFLAELAAAAVDRFVFSSTAAVYGMPDAMPITEATPTQPINPYGATKLRFEDALREAAAHAGLRAMALRYFNVAGASAANGEVHEPETHLIPNLLRAVETGEAVTLFGDDYPTPDGTAVRDYVHVLDLADAHLAALELTGTMTAGLEVANLGSGSGFSVRQVVDGRRGCRRWPHPADGRTSTRGRSPGPRRRQRPGTGAARMGAATRDAGGDDRLRLGLASGAPLGVWAAT